MLTFKIAFFFMKSFLSFFFKPMPLQQTQDKINNGKYGAQSLPKNLFPVKTNK